MSQARRSGGFTLVELLVVIGIIAVLISILLPSLNRARENAKTVQCLSNLRMIGMGLRMYMQANNGKCPPTRFNSVSQPSNQYDGLFWANFLNEGKYVTVRSDTGGVFMCPNSTDELETNYYAPQTSRTDNSGFFNMRSSDNPQGNASNLRDVKNSYAVNGTWSNSSGDTPWWNNDQYNPGPIAARYSELFPFVIYEERNPIDPGMAPKAPTVLKSKNSTKLALVFDGFYMHAMSANYFKLRHGSSKLKQKDRMCNFVFVDGHADSLRGSEIPGNKPGDMFYPPAQLNTPGMTWNVVFSPISR